jgi:flagellar hook assembly protein FlgD
MPSAGRAGVEVFDVGGRQVAQLGPVLYEAGSHALTWDGTGKAGTMVPAGVYLIRLTTNHRQATTQLVRSSR